MNITWDVLLGLIYLFGVFCFFVGYGLVYALNPVFYYWGMSRNKKYKSGWEMEQEIWAVVAADRQKELEKGNGDGK